MTRPSKVNTPPDIHALVDELGADNALQLALEILARESSSWALFLRCDDDSSPRDAHGERVYRAVAAADPNEHHRLRDAVAEWLKKQ